MGGRSILHKYGPGTSRWDAHSSCPVEASPPHPFTPSGPQARVSWAGRRNPGGAVAGRDRRATRRTVFAGSGDRSSAAPSSPPTTTTGGGSSSTPWCSTSDPRNCPKRPCAYTHTFGLGGMSLVLVLLLFATGILMMFVYQPSPEAAYDSITSLQDDVLFGRLVRNIHHWSANLLVGIALLHLLRVYLTGGYHAPATVQLGRRAGSPALHPGRQLHRLPPALGSAVLLGDHHLDGDAGLCPVDRRAAAVARPRRARDLVGHPHRLLHDPHHGGAGGR